MNDQKISIRTAQLCSGFGQFHTNEPGKDKTKPYASITWPEIVALADKPPSLDKTQSQWIIPSTLLSRSHKTQETDGSFWLLWTDIDKNQGGLDAILTIVLSLFGETIPVKNETGLLTPVNEDAGGDYLIYTSKSATQINQKCRVIIPLKIPLSFNDWRICQEILNDKFQSAGIEPDRANERAGQLCYLPNRGEFYETRVRNWRVYFDPVAAFDSEIQAKKAAIEAQKAQLDKHQTMAKKSRNTNNLNGKSIYQAFNDAYTPQDWLLSAGYDQCGASFRHPNSKSGSYSATVKPDLNGILRVNSLSQNDPLFSTQGAHDAFSTFKILMHGNDEKAALLDAGNNLLTINGRPWNKVVQREFMAEKTEKTEPQPKNEPPLEQSDDVYLQGLPSFDSLEYRQNRKASAKYLNVTVTSLDALIKTRDKERTIQQRRDAYQQKEVVEDEPYKNPPPEEMPGDSPLGSVINSLVAQIGEVDFIEECKNLGWRSKDDKPPALKHYKVAIAHRLLATAKANNWHLATDGGFFYCYNGCYWLPMDEGMVKSLAKKSAIKMQYAEINAREENFVNALHRQIMQDGFFPKRCHNKESLINLKNGTLVLSDGEPKLRGFSHRDFLTHQLDFEYDPKATNLLFIKFLTEVLPDKDTRKTLQQVAGYLFVKGLKLEKIFFLLGSGSNGKSVFFDVFTGIIGKTNVTGYSAESLTDEKGYHRAMIQNAIVNYGADVRFKDINPGFFKLLASGEPVEAREPFGKPFIMEDYAKLIFNVNRMESMSLEDTHGFKRRLLIIPFAETIPDEKQDRDLTAKILKNKAGILNWVIEGARDVITSRDVFVSDKCQEAKAKFIKEANNVALYEEDWVKSHKDMDYHQGVTAAYKDYLSVCQEAGRRYPCGRNEFVKRMQELGFVHSETGQGSFLKKEYRQNVTPKKERF